MGAKGQSSYRDPPFLPWRRKEESLGAIVGSKRSESPCQYLHWAKGPVQGRTPPRPWEESLLNQVWPKKTKERPITESGTPGHFME